MEEKKEKKPIYKKVWFWVITIFILFIIIIASTDTTTQTTTSTTETNKVETKTAEPITYTAIDVDTLKNDLENNAAAAKEKYNGKYLEISGRLGTIDSDLKYISLLSSNNKYDFLGIHCKVKNSEQKDIIKTFSKDDSIIVKGKITDVGEIAGYYLDINEISK